MGYLDTELTDDQRIALDSLSLAEFSELCHNHNGPLERAVLDHYRETQLWWAPIIVGPSGEQFAVNPPDEVPEPARLRDASARGTFLLDPSHEISDRFYPR